MIKQQNIAEGNHISVIIFEVGGEEFAIDLLDVKEIIQSGQIRTLPKCDDFIEGIYNYRGNIIHIINLKKKLNIKKYNLHRTTSKDLEDETIPQNFIIIVNISGINFGFLVDRIINVAHIDEKDLEGLSPIFQTSIGVEYIKGIVKFKDRPRILVNLNKVLSESEQITIKNELKQ